MTPPKQYAGIYFMLLAGLGFSVMGGFAKELRNSFNTPQLVFYRNLVGLIFLGFTLARYPVKQSGGRIWLLIFRGIMGTLALYTLLYNIINIPLGAAITYNTINTFYIAILSWWLLKERLSPIAWTCIICGFAGILLIYRPSIDFGWKYHFIGLLHGLISAIAYLSIGRLNKYYDARIIVLSFLSSGVLLPLLTMGIGYAFQLPHDDFFFPVLRAPVGIEWFYLAGLGMSALLGQYFVTRAYSSDKAGIVSAIGYSNIVFAMLIGILLGDPIPDLLAIGGVLIVIASGVVISLTKK